MSKLKVVWNYVRRHKYLITILAFLLIIGVLDEENSLIQRVKHKREIFELKREIKYYRNQYEESSRELKELTSNPEVLEKAAREKYLMKKQNEDIYIFEEDLNQKNEK
ncbi:septum formation initiator family protein [uncultured Phocaeicola sp.]|uniref:FtsB family cell division protein n=1 Tax=uncultured Phocaeicola sp. TaxID=990718 RepID=UPI0025E72E74|nr:septum formation initiator family protein [uncultured Phocaeicola sp.]